jgi:hypothetical protein
VCWGWGLMIVAGTINYRRIVRRTKRDNALSRLMSVLLYYYQLFPFALFILSLSGENSPKKTARRRTSLLIGHSLRYVSATSGMSAHLDDVSPGVVPRLGGMTAWTNLNAERRDRTIILLRFILCCYWTFFWLLLLILLLLGRTTTFWTKSNVIVAISRAVSHGLRRPVIPTARANQTGVIMHVSLNSM